MVVEGVELATESGCMLPASDITRTIKQIEIFLCNHPPLKVHLLRYFDSPKELLHLVPVFKNFLRGQFDFQE